MLSWATGKLESLAQTVAPPPSDPKSRFLHSCQRGNQDEAVEALEEMPNPLNEVVIPAKHQGTLLVACLYGLPLVVDKIITVGIQQEKTFNIMQVVDGEGNTPLHCACMSNQPGAIALVKLLLDKIPKTSLGVKNYIGQTPYDVAALGVVRQYILPIQLQAETQAALDNGGTGLPPGIDMCGLKVTNSTLAPPPTMPGGITVTPPTPPPVAQPQPPRSSPESGNRPPSAPTSTGSQYALRGRSSAALVNLKGIQPDGFHSSSSDKTLQQKYGHESVRQHSAIPPPPASGNSVGSYGSAPVSAGAPPMSGGPNPYSAGLSALSGTNRRALRYVAFDPINGAHAPPPANAAQPSVAPAPYVSTFMPPPPSMSASRESSVSSVASSPVKRLNSQGSFSNPTTPRSMSPFAKPPAASATAVFSRSDSNGGEVATQPAVPHQEAPKSGGTPSQLFARPPTMSSLKGAPSAAATFTKPVTSPSAAFAKPSRSPSAADAFSKPNATPSAPAAFAKPAGVLSATKSFSTPNAAASTFTKPPGSVFSQPPATTPVVAPKAPADPQKEHVDDVLTDDEGEMDEVPLTPGCEGGADGIDTANGMPAAPLSQN